MRMKMICEIRTLKDTATEFLAFKKAQKVRERSQTVGYQNKCVDAGFPNGLNSWDLILQIITSVPGCDHANASCSQLDTAVLNIPFNLRSQGSIIDQIVGGKRG